MFIIAGLGNPGNEYRDNRHNLGFMTIDSIRSIYPFSSWKRKFFSEISDGYLDGIRTILVKPQTFMNLSGKSLGEIIDFYKPTLQNCLIVHDELDLPVGKLRLKTGGGDSGHNGLKSISERCGRDYKRLRIGIGRPQQKEYIAQYVLNNFSPEEKCLLTPILDNIARCIPLLAQNKDDAFLRNVLS
ncbi:MAG: aminoacyl-tRNA hydrolase [Candidatus Liberibacter ctenarytainae]|uniref:Peptidyl-tRNA hydrolase n=1 Tax=Candidatus Liberibacter ctenarytainae TaxID=2020335 RepID=A0A937AS80_9HYPH|nr:aminoacyl-tRNA hydrolase [Candidatus Liberibacter ctenarytainae]